MNAVKCNPAMSTALIVLTSSFFLPSAEAEGPDEASNDRPNIILFLTDDQDKESIGTYGGKTPTPNLDRLAREGLKLNQAYVSTTVCTPSRYTFLTGRYAGNSYSDEYLSEVPLGSQGSPGFNMALEEDKMNVGNILALNGYTTGFVGKFHVGRHLKNEKQFTDSGLEYVSKSAEADSEATVAYRNNERWYRKQMLDHGFSYAKNIYWENLKAPFGHHNPEWTIDAALEFIEENKDGPFYLHYSTTLLHGPDKSWRDSMDHPRSSGEGMLDKAPEVMTDRTALLKSLQQKNLDPDTAHAGNAWVDDSIGAILKKLDELGISDNTIVVFISDHGSNLKGSLFDVDGVNVPSIIRWPGKIQPGTESEALVQNIDFVPTFFDAADAVVPEQYKMDGQSLVPLLTQGESAQWRDDLYFELGAARAVRTRDWKYIAVRYTAEQVERIQGSAIEELPKQMSYLRRMGIGTRGSLNPNFFDGDQLYHVSEDPLEQQNLANAPEHQERLAEMKELLASHLKDFNRPYGEFIPGGNATQPGQVTKQLEDIKTLTIRGKQVILPTDGVP